MTLRFDSLPSALPRAVAGLLVLGLLGPIGAGAQDLPLSMETPVPGTNSYSEDIPRPQEVIGHVIGTQHTRPAQVVDYFEAVAKVSDRVTLRSHGRTYEGRELIHAVVTSTENHGRLGEIRRANVATTENPGSVTDSDLQDRPAVVVMGYSIHGDEASGTEAAVLLLYHLAAGNGPEVQATLDNVVTLIDPMFNPDGRDRFVDWVNGNRGAVATADEQDREHNQPWPGGRTNHYWFDLNRDWLPVQHPSSQGRIDYFHHWKPQFLTDFHEMGSDDTYFFQPGVPSRTNPNTTDRNQELTGDVAEFHADYLEEIGSFYFTRENYDDFYYGKGSTYPDVNGTIGILFEQGSSRALKADTDKGVVSYAFTVRNQFTTSLSTLKAMVEHRTDLLQYQRDFFANRQDVLEDFETEAYVIDRSDKRTRAQALAKVLRRHDVELYELGQDVNSGGQSFSAGEAYVVPLDQPQGRFVKAAMERTSTYPDSLFYDVSTWTLPLAFDVNYAALESTPGNLRGAELSDVSFDGGAVEGGRSSYAYAFEWGRYYGARALRRLHKHGIRPRVMTDTFTGEVDGQSQSFDRGSIVIQVHQRGVSPDTVHAVIERIAANDHLRVHALDGGMTPSGPDLGSPSAEILNPPNVALLTGSGASGYNAGEVWHLLNERMKMPISLLDTENVDSDELEAYDTLVLAGGWYGNLPTEDIQEWVGNGGTLIGIQGGSEWAVENELVELEEREVDIDSLLQDVPYAEIGDTYGAQGIGGSIFQAELDTTHPIAYGFDETVPVFRSGTGFYDPSDDPGASVGTYSETEPRLSGYVSEEQLEVVPGAASIEAHGYGGGQVILFMDNPNFRAFWYGSNGLFLNAVFFGQIL